MAALISTVMHTKDKVPYFVNASRQMGINVLPPDVNESMHDFRVLDGRRHPLRPLRREGRRAPRRSTRSSRRAPSDPSTSIYDFAGRVSKEHANKRVLEALVKAGAFDCTGDTRKGMFDVIASGDAARREGARRRRERAVRPVRRAGRQRSAGRGRAERRPSTRRSRAASGPFLERLDYEREATGLYMSGHPIDEWREAIDARVERSIGDVLADGAEMNRMIEEEGWVPPQGDAPARTASADDKRTRVKVGGLVKEYRSLVTKKGQPMAFFQLEGTDEQTIRVVVFPAVFESVREKLQGERRVIILDARLEAKDGSVDLMAERVCTLEEAPELNAVTGARAPSTTFAGPAR